MRRDQSWVAWEKSIPDRKMNTCEHLGIKDTERVMLHRRKWVSWYKGKECNCMADVINI